MRVRFGQLALLDYRTASRWYCFISRAPKSFFAPLALSLPKLVIGNLVKWGY